ncbi:NAD/NADP octopine/nopaline dehydrogenase family protein [Sagittula sp. MA-2]|jgi:opine dehydrogenase|uniref:NAD/NADP octopine/nopaline dehydrogenase family protein n=1 Tax=Sagittula sp. MA-2 TaxID=3048007 RepID=UPI0024C33E5C|nr:NAD/NADP octopine/nopaline dehydrogenase family protein [Sagittula sp. MA-2]WHZ38068.1 NAD/NADP octopine/nopaline dehydrogenase family protein [Sagittula sp. MA-2]
MKATVVGGGPVGLTYCALLKQAGHDVRLWSQSRSGSGVEHFTGEIEGDHRIEQVAGAEEAAAFAEVLVMARCAQGNRAALDALVPHLRPEQVVIFSAELSYASVYLRAALAAAGRSVRTVSWSTTVPTAQRNDGGIRVGTLRDTVDMASAGFEDAEEATALCVTLFGPRFRYVGDVLRIGLSNLNPQIHLANAIANLTRIERGESWENYECITPAVGRLIEDLDTERLALAESYGFEVRSVHDHYLMTFPGLTPGTVSEMAGQVFRRAPGTLGPRSLDTRYIWEDVPFGLVPLCALARAKGAPMELHEAGIRLLAGYLGADFRAKNDMLSEVLEAL